MTVNSLILSPRAQASIVREEGIVLFVYKDIDTHGVEHRANGIGNNDDSMPLDLIITRDEALVKFHENRVRFEAVVNKVITRPLLQHEYDALTHRAFNSGVRGFEEGEAELIQYVNADNDRLVSMELVKDGNLGRRIREANMYVNGYYNTKAYQVPLFEKDIRHFRMVVNPIWVERWN